ncbi:MAG: hypothetical protein IJO10_03985 [Clostridia bacterium]|nr:hypothetical protein [Clostridia bacterium]
MEAKRQDPQGKNVFDKNTDLISLDGPITGPVPAGFRQDEQGLNNSMLRNTEKVNTAAEKRCTAAFFSRIRSDAASNPFHLEIPRKKTPNGVRAVPQKVGSDSGAVVRALATEQASGA